MAAAVAAAMVVAEVETTEFGVAEVLIVARQRASWFSMGAEAVFRQNCCSGRTYGQTDEPTDGRTD